MQQYVNEQHPLFIQLQQQVKIIQETQVKHQQIQQQLQAQIQQLQTNMHKFQNKLRQQNSLNTNAVIPWPSMLTDNPMARRPIRKPKFIAAFSNILGVKNVVADYKMLQSKASAVVDKIQASYQAVGKTISTIKIMWDDLPITLKQCAINELEKSLDLTKYPIDRAEDHWMAEYLLNNQCTIQVVGSFIDVIREAEGILSKSPSPIIKQEKSKNEEYAFPLPVEQVIISSPDATPTSPSSIEAAAGSRSPLGENSSSSTGTSYPPAKHSTENIRSRYSEPYLDEVMSLPNVYYYAYSNYISSLPNKKTEKYTQGDPMEGPSKFRTFSSASTFHPTLNGAPAIVPEPKKGKRKYQEYSSTSSFCPRYQDNAQNSNMVPDRKGKQPMEYYPIEESNRKWQR
ncbi:hypothetical protein BCR42DRAFT_387125 [Absidia repens]|uniref:Uncharacterized protein n=1 Tax=Absidia repens TaxID=90262 RepID=A0A1X2IYC8_9FUNG|nr:hypothetical protein BCR42DRAFT_387125 [Absidia repens]